jgi:hypothetical protein
MILTQITQRSSGRLRRLCAPATKNPVRSKTSKPSITLGFCHFKFLSTSSQRFTSPPIDGADNRRHDPHSTNS